MLKYNTIFKKIKPHMKLASILLSIWLVVVFSFLFISKLKKNAVLIPEKRWKLSAIDTVKYSRDIAREKDNSADFIATIDKQVRLISETGATHVSIGTPYDEEFVPFLSKWVSAARKYKLKVWFRGNFSGWEEWFGYPSITREQHKEMLKTFIVSNGNLFEDGDVFTSCPECENGGDGDPRSNEDLLGHRKFLIDEYQISKESFRNIGKNVITGYYPMNGDVAKLVMDVETTRSVGGVVVVDHYVEDPIRLNNELSELAELSGGKVVLGEYGAPIPDIHGAMNEEEQADWINELMTLLHTNTNVIGISYWTNRGGSTEIWNKDYSPKKSVTILTKYFNF